MAKYCKQCGKLNENPLLKLCREHYYQEQLDNPKQLKFKIIKNKSTTNKNTPAKFTSKTKAEILLRDKHCLFCPNAIQDYHHIYYGGQAEYGPDRNDPNKGVGLCRHHHELIHHFTDGSSQKIRKQCITYIKTYEKGGTI